MLISHSNRFVFLHNPKVAGTTVRNRLRSLCGADDYHLAGLLNRSLKDRSHLMVSEWTQELWDAYRDGYYFFGFVRDPLDRLLSAFSEFRHQHHELFAGAFGEDIVAVLRGMLTQSSVVSDWRLTHFSPQWSYFGLGPSAEEMLPGIHILRFEQLADEWGILARRVGADPSPLPNDRPSFYRERTPKEILSAYASLLYADDYREFGYAPADPSPALLADPMHHTRLEVLCRLELNQHLDLLRLDNFEAANLASGKRRHLESTSTRLLAEYAAASIQIRSNREST